MPSSSSSSSNGITETAPQRKSKKAWENCCSQYQKKRTRETIKNINTAITYTENEDFKPTKVEITNKVTGDVILCTEQNGELAPVPKMSSTPRASNEVVNQTLYIKEKFNISNQTYHALTQVHKDLPRTTNIIKTAKKMNEGYTICSTPGTFKGVQQSLKNHLKTIIQKRNYVPESSTIRVKLTGDGTVVSRSVHLVVIAFAIVDAHNNPNSPRGNHTIALINTTESYDNLSESLKDLIAEISEIKSITCTNGQWDIEFFLGADLKFLAICMGIEAANSTFSCIWCKCPSGERYKQDVVWSVTDTDYGARTISEIQRLSCLKKTKNNQKYGCIRNPLFPTIPVHHVVPDILHLFLRITDVLINLLIQDLRRLDGIEKTRIQSFSRTDAVNVAKYERFLNDSCKISFHMYVEKDAKMLKWRDLTGPEKLKLFNTIDISTLFTNLTNPKDTQKLWVDFISIYNTLCLESITKDQIKMFKIAVENWLKLFIKLYQTKNVTPYIHILSCHVHEFLDLYGSLAPFSQQGLEKLNDDITKDYFRSTNHHDDALQQILLKLNRLEDLRETTEIPKQAHYCKNCKESGHNSRTCKLLPSD